MWPVLNDQFADLKFSSPLVMLLVGPPGTSRVNIKQPRRTNLHRPARHGRARPDPWSRPCAGEGLTEPLLHGPTARQPVLRHRCRTSVQRAGSTRHPHGGSRTARSPVVAAIRSAAHATW